VGNNPYANGTYGQYNRIGEMLSDLADEQARDAKARDLAMAHIREHPFHTVKLWPKKLWYLYSRESIGLYWNQQGLPSQVNQELATVFTLLMAVAQLYYGLIWLFFLGALLILLRIYKIRLFPFLGLGVIVYFTGVVILTFGIGRFHFPIIPWMIMYIGAGIAALMGLMPLNMTSNHQKLRKGD
jgi:hypothetical protein